MKKGFPFLWWIWKKWHQIWQQTWMGTQADYTQKRKKMGFHKFIVFILLDHQS
jgi:hypothetical protein